MAKLAKKYIKLAQKKVPSSQWRARGLKTAWALQKKAQKGGGRAKTVSKPKGKPRAKSNPKGGSVSSNKSPKIGAAIQAFKGTQPLLSPAIDAGVRRGLNEEAVTLLRSKANAAYVGNVAMTAANQLVDRKIAQGAALSRGSITAWAAEALAALKVADEVKGKDGRGAALAANNKLTATLNGYKVTAPGGRIDLTDPDFRMYQTLKIAGGVARRLSNIGPFKRITAPAKKFLSQAGGAL